MQKVNVLFVIIQMALGGSEQLILNIIRNLDRNRFSPSVAWFFGDTILEEFADLNIPLFHVPKTKSFDFNTMQHLAAILTENDVHVVNAHHFMSMVYLFYGSKVKKQAKLIYTEHSEWEVEAIPKKWQLLGAGLLRCVDKTVGVSPAISDCLQKKFFIPLSKVETINNGVDLNLFSNTQKNLVIKKELKIGSIDKVIGTVANLKKVKNHRFLLNAFKKLAEEFDKVKLILVGQGFKDDPENTEEEIKDFIETNGLNNKVLILGYRSDISQLLSVMDIFCLTSKMEGLPISLIEAMASGLPVVGSDAPGIKDVIEHGVNGFLIPQDDTAALKNALLNLVRNDSLRVRMGNHSKLMANLYSMESCIKNYENLFSKLCAL
ncbi:MAG: glycosyltransferase [Desulfobacteraceae bacterium]|nr:glycosyltransferase [Desulfobacteraceae bacterium]MBC2754845.1 glycosyltransferase [Desulfobacteraceae bacterium]